MKTRWMAIAAVLALAGSPVVGAAERGAATASVGGKKVSIDYGQPSLKGRPFDELLKQLPEDRVWRAGENQVTTLTTEGPIRIGGKALAAGKYSLYVLLGADGSRTLLVNSDLGIPLIKLWDKAPADVANEPWPRLDGYTKNIAAKEVARAALKKETGPTVDVFSISLAPAGKGATLRLAWGTESWSIDVTPGS
jgi:uncharacterized protein (DUF2141 family)